MRDPRGDTAYHIVEGTSTAPVYDSPGGTRLMYFYAPSLCLPHLAVRSQASGYSCKRWTSERCVAWRCETIPSQTYPRLSNFAQLRTPRKHRGLPRLPSHSNPPTSPCEECLDAWARLWATLRGVPRRSSSGCTSSGINRGRIGVGPGATLTDWLTH